MRISDWSSDVCSSDLRGSGKGLVRRRGRTDDEVDVAGPHAGLRHRLAGRGGAEVGGHLAVGGDVALVDAGALTDPLVGGIDPLGEIRIGDDLCRQVGPTARDEGTIHFYTNRSEELRGGKKWGSNG